MDQSEGNSAITIPEQGCGFIQSNCMLRVAVLTDILFIVSVG